MQELISELKCIDEFPMISGIIKRAEYHLEKEKEHIVTAWNDSKVSIMNGEQYFEETFNQNK